MRFHSFLSKALKTTLCLTALLNVSFFVPNMAHAGATERSSTDPKDVKQFVLLRPDDNTPFWKLFEDVMKDACEDLGCEVEVTYAGGDRFKMVEQAKKLGERARKPDMVFFQSYKKNGASIIKTLDANGINGFLVNAGLTPEQAQEMAKPREKYPRWIGQMMPDDMNAGASIAEALYKAAKEKNYLENGKVRMIGIEGNITDGASVERVKGLRSVVGQYDDIELLQIVQGKWEEELSHRLTLSLMRRYPEVHVIWAAGDMIAMGIVGAAKEIDKNILTVGVDWAPRVLEEIKNGNIVGSAGGHFMEGAWSAIVAYDYLMGIDFATSDSVELKSNMAFLNKNNLSNYTEKFGSGEFGAVDFKQFSKYHNKELKSYSFDILPLIE